MSIWTHRSNASWKLLASSVPQLFILLVVLLAATMGAAQVQKTEGYPGIPEIGTGEIRTLASSEADQILLHNARRNSANPPKPSAERDTCLLPPLTFTSTPTISAEQLRISTKAIREYREACASLKSQKLPDAEKHLRKAVRQAPKDAAAWVTLGQVLAAQQQLDEAHTACFQGSTVAFSYVPAYLCLADIAAQAHAWADGLKPSTRALELDPTNNALAYEYHAAASLNLHNLVTAEKSGLRAVEIDTEHHEPRVHFVLAQIYEAKGDSANEATQLREYLKYATNPDDALLAQQHLSRLEKQASGAEAFDVPSRSRSSEVSSFPSRRWAPPDIDAAIPPVLGDTNCRLSQILKETSNRTEDLIENLERFTASERIEQIDLDKNGKRRSTAFQAVNYVAQIEQNSAGYPNIQEYRSGAAGTRQPSIVDSGTAALALIFHPTHIRDFDFRCEGMTELSGKSAWQVRFEESANSKNAFTAIRMGGSLYLPRLKGRAWIATETYEVLRLETDLVSPIPQIDLQLEHLIVGYAPVEFPKHHVRLWLPESTSIYVAYRGHRYQRLHTFSQFQLFSVGSDEAIKDPVGAKDGQPQ